MSHKKKDRLDTLRVLIGGRSCLCNSSRLTDIYGEINRIATSDQVPRHNGSLLAVLYTTRTLDTLLSEIVRCKGWTAHTANLNGYLVALHNNGIVLSSEKRGYDLELVHVRNRYMHEAGAMLRSIDANKILNKMHACVVTIISAFNKNRW